MHPNEGQKQAGVRLTQHLDSFPLPLVGLSYVYLKSVLIVVEKKAGALYYH